jgi:pyruvate dehydrogenase E2 component (dihydrolipoamide acetyltransferase)
MMGKSHTNVIMPALGMSQDAGRLVRWLKKAGEWVEKGEPLMEVETDKAVEEIEAPASGYLAQVLAQEGEEVPVAQVIAILEGAGQEGEPKPEPAAPPVPVPTAPPFPPRPAPPFPISPLAARIAAEHHVDPAQIRPRGARIEKADVLFFLQASESPTGPALRSGERILASPKARRLAAELGVDLAGIRDRGAGRGPQGAVLAADVLAASALSGSVTESEIPLSLTWSRMVQRLSASWPETPQFFLMREVDARRLIAWRQAEQAQTALKLTYTDLLVKLAAAALRAHPRVNASFQAGKIQLNREVNIGLAVAVEEGLVVPVIRQAAELSVSQIAGTRAALVERARAGRLRLEDLQGGTFTVSNLGMYKVDAFCAVVNPPQAAIMAVSRIAERVTALNGAPVVQPMLTITVSFDHRVVDGARGAEFLQTLGDFIEEGLPD